MKKIGWIIIIIVIIWGIVSLRDKDTGDTFKIGVVYGFTGAAAADSEMGRYAIDLAVEEINEAGGVNGQMFEVIYEDNETEAAKSVSAYKKLVDFDKVDVVLGSVFDFITNPLVPLTKDDKVVTIAPVVVSESIESESDYFFSTGHAAANAQEAIRTFFRMNPDVETVALLCWNNAWGEAHKNAYEQVVAELGKEIVAEECTYFGSDYRTEILKLKAANPDAMLVSGYSDVYLPKLIELGIDTKIIGTQNIVGTLERSGVDKSLVQGIYIFDWQPNQEFIDTFYAKYDTYPILEAHNHYDTVYAIKKALELGESDLREALKQVTYEGIVGSYNFTIDRQNFTNQTKAKLYVVEGEEYKLVE